MVRYLRTNFLCFYFLPALIFFGVKQSFASHIVGGELIYECLGNNNYLITLKVYRDCFNGQAPYDNPSNVFIYNNQTGAQVTVLPMPFPGSTILPNNPNNPCLIVPPNICVEEAIFTYQVNLPPTTGGYKLIYQRCCRNYTIVNIFDPSNTGATYEGTMPDQNLAICNSSPYFVNFPPTLICVNEPFIFDHSAIDPDGDSLVYELCNPYNGANSVNPYPYPPLAYGNVTFVSPYSYSDPMGGAPPMAIDPVTGELTVTPLSVGQFVVGVCVSEYRNGDLLSVHRRDFQFNVTTCNSATASINGGNNTLNNPALFNSCDGFTFYFPNNSSSATTYHWDFGIPGTTSDTSNLFNPIFTFPDTGVYLVTLIVNPGSNCGDTAYGLVYVYPVLVADFVFPNGCETDSLQFLDQSSSTNGYLNYWYWTFGDGTSSFDQDPVHVYDTIGSFFVQLIVGTNLGCLDTVTGVININPKPDATAYPEDTTICYLDTIQLFGYGLGNYQWTPDYNLNDDTAAWPLASPDDTTVYILTITNQWGCVDQDTIQVNVFDTLVAYAGTDTVICPGEQVQLNGTGGLYFSWSPSTGLSAVNIPNPVAAPLGSTTYVLATSVGSCFDSDSIVIEVKPFPEIVAGPDQEICIGDSVMISACCGTDYSWTPANSLSDANIENPMAFPSATTLYHMTATDSLSCLVVVEDSLMVTVVDPPPLIITPDTLIFLGTSAQLYAIGAEYYQWSPPDWLSDLYVYNPISTPLKTISYVVNAITDKGCPLSDSVKVTVVEDPHVVFPNAFTPNGDGLNDYFLPVVLGLFNAESFRVFNRWGEMIYETKDVTQGWDGTHEGKQENVGTYVYMLSGESTTTGKTYFLKGNVVLLR